MGSLTDLNTYAQDLIEATDERNPGPKLWPNVPLDLNQTSLTGTFAINRVIEIEEIVRPADAQLRFQVDVSSVPLATVNWPTIPAGCTVVNPSTGVYYITGIDSIAIWDQVKNPNIVLPVDFYGNFEYYVSWIWFDDVGYQSEEYTVGTYVPVALLQSAFSQTVQGVRIQDLGTFLLSSAFSCQANPSVSMLPATFSATSSMVANIRRFVRTTAALSVSTSISAEGIRIRPWSNYETANYWINNYQPGNFPNIEKPWSTYNFDESKLPSYTSVRTVLTVDSGRLRLDYEQNVQSQFEQLTGTSYDNPTNTSIRSIGSSSIDVTHYAANTNPTGSIYFDPENTLQEIYFYPPYNVTSPIGYNFKIYVDGVLREDYNGTLTKNPSSTLSTVVDNTIDEYSFSSSSFTWIPPAYSVAYHNRADFYLVGGGGGGAIGGGGSGGQIIAVTNIPINSFSSFAVTRGSFGNRGTGTSNGTAGGNTTITIAGTTWTALGGAGGTYNGGAGSNGSGVPLPSTSDYYTSAGYGGAATGGNSNYEAPGAGGKGGTVGGGGNYGGAGFLFYRTYRQ